MYDFKSAWERPCCAGAVHPSGKVTNAFHCCLQRAWCNLLSIASAVPLAIFVWHEGMKLCKARSTNREESQGPNRSQEGRRHGESTKEGRRKEVGERVKKHKEGLRNKEQGRKDKENASRDGLHPRYRGLALSYYLLCSYVTSVKISDSACQGIYIMLTPDSGEPAARLASPLWRLLRMEKAVVYLSVVIFFSYWEISSSQILKWGPVTDTT